MEASGSFHGRSENTVRENQTNPSTESRTKASTESFTKACTKTFTDSKASTKALPKLLPLSFMESSGSFHGRSEAHRLPRKVSRTLPVKALKIASMKDWKVHSMNIFVSLPRTLPQLTRNLSGFHDSPREFLTPIGPLVDEINTFYINNTSMNEVYVLLPCQLVMEIKSRLAWKQFIRKLPRTSMGFTF